MEVVKALEVVEPAFIQEPQHRPKQGVKPAEGIPLIDLSGAISNSSPETLKKVAREVGNACKEWGFFQVINHGVPAETLKKLESARNKFFSLPLEEKRKVRRAETNFLGYYEHEFTKNVRDWNEHYDISLIERYPFPASPDVNDTTMVDYFNRWPENPPEFREACEEFLRETEKLAFKLLELIALSLGLPGNRFNGYFKDQTSFIRLNYYPQCPNPDLALGIGRHKDGNVLTVLAQGEVSGLEVSRKTDGKWIAVKPIPNAYTINIGNMMQVWTNEIYESVEHRVTGNSETERYSALFSLNPSHYVTMKPLEELTIDENPPKYREFNYGKFTAFRKLSNFKKLNAENIQVEHFRI
ncbi:protein DMR6-LIKE OXYGENASE 2 [Ziziphus jujuba]|uniref:Protein DMR6-LIKE OXYGENASE 2 n=2 Tax=Ziziphus jujuba TaxID=326968 RepID=A0A6P6FYK1_ZIZJJ|nr:protein DMR6-LIKE OXYGENASE 2 [Ziziphus jujuba]KAH7517924.1 hypothetical protein FEM48_Zijuj09G0115800 [Ziziphus jujuba var. spinosa]